MYDPSTLAFSFPPYPAGGVSFRGKPKPWSFGRFLYGLAPWIGVDIWHVDPEKPGTGNRTDDSCGWFDRSPGPYADAVRYILADKATMFEVGRALRTRTPVNHPGGLDDSRGYTYSRMPLAETMAVCVMVARELELRRWWNGQNGDGGAHAKWMRRAFTRVRDVTDQAHALALNPIDNLSTAEEPETLVKLIAANLHRHYRPWWKHPRWHVHHWKVNFHIARNLIRMFEPCATCGKALGFGYCPVLSGGAHHHTECLGISVANAETSKA
jgi:hypothetical protein